MQTTKRDGLRISFKLDPYALQIATTQLVEIQEKEAKTTTIITIIIKASHRQKKKKKETHTEEVVLQLLYVDKTPNLRRKRASKPVGFQRPEHSRTKIKFQRNPTDEMVT